MKGRDRFTSTEAAEIRRLLKLVRRAEPGTPQKLLRDQLRRLGFYISDFAGGSAGFTASDFDALERSGRVTIINRGAPSNKSTARTLGRGGRSTVVPRAADSSQAPAEEPVSTQAVARDTATALRVLSENAISIKTAMEGGVPDRPGLYALYGSAAVWRSLGLGSPPDRRPLYVGKAEDSLVSRDLKTHFATGKTGQSSPRRSFAALLVHTGSLELMAIPRRRHDPEPKKWTHYGLEDPGDEALTNWMCSRLRIAVWPARPTTRLATVEGKVMQEWLPPLNLMGVRTPWTHQVKTARAAMAASAPAWARDGGFDV